MDVKDRLILIPHITGLPTQAAVAAAMGIGYSRWMNIVGGEYLSARVATQLIRTFHGLTRDWLYDGAEGGLSLQMVQRIRAAEAAERANNPGPPVRQSPKQSKRR
jgi:hypothetical protein